MGKNVAGRRFVGEDTCMGACACCPVACDLEVLDVMSRGVATRIVGEVLREDGFPL